MLCFLCCWVYREKLASNTQQMAEIYEFWRKNGYIQKKSVQIPGSARLFCEISHYAGYMAEN